MGVMYSVTDLAKLEWMGGKQIHRFLMMWRLTIDQMQTTFLVSLTENGEVGWPKGRHRSLLRDGRGAQGQEL